MPEQADVQPQANEQEDIDQDVDNTVKTLYISARLTGGESMSAPRINSLQALLEYAHKLPWGRENKEAVLTLNETMTEINQQVDASSA